MKDIILEIKESIISKISQEQEKLIPFLPKNIKAFKSVFEISDIYKISRTKMKPGFNVFANDLIQLLHTYAKVSDKHLKILLTYLSPRMDWLFDTIKNLNIENSIKIEKEIYKDIVEYLFKNNIGLVHKEVKRIKINNLSYEELLQHGYIGLLNGIRKYNWTLNIKLSTYVTYWIRESIYRAVNQNFYIKYDQKTKDVYREILDISKKYNIQFNEITIDDLMFLKPELFEKYTKDEIYDALNINWTYSLDYSNEIDEDDNRNIISDTYSIKHHKDIEESFIFEDILKILRQKLNDTEFSMIIEYFDLDKYYTNKPKPYAQNTFKINHIDSIIAKIRSDESLMTILKTMKE